MSDQFFVAPDAYGDAYVWSGECDSNNCEPLLSRRELDRKHPALWPALLTGLGLSDG